jgi:hypothetical protein
MQEKLVFFSIMHGEISPPKNLKFGIEKKNKKNLVCYQIFDTHDQKWKIIMVESKSGKNDFMNLK